MKILIPIDGSYHSDCALESVLAEPWPKDSNFLVMTVAEPMHTLADSTLGSFGQMALRAQEALDDDIHKLLKEAADKLREKFGAKNVTESFYEGRPAAQILDIAQSWKADLIVMGAHGTSGYNDETLGDICSIIVSHAPCSVRIVHYLSSASLEKKLASHKPLVTSRLLLAIDRSVKSKVAVDAVVNRPWSDGATVQVLTVAASHVNPMHSRFFQAAEIEKAKDAIVKAEKSEAEKMVKEVADKLEEKFGKGKVTYHVLEGHNIRSLILQVAQDWPADLIVIGAHGQDKNIIEHLLGSTARAVVENAMCSVEVVR